MPAWMRTWVQQQQKIWKFRKGYKFAYAVFLLPSPPESSFSQQNHLKPTELQQKEEKVNKEFPTPVFLNLVPTVVPSNLVFFPVPLTLSYQQECCGFLEYMGNSQRVQMTPGWENLLYTLVPTSAHISKQTSTKAFRKQPYLSHSYEQVLITHSWSGSYKSKQQWDIISQQWKWHISTSLETANVGGVIVRKELSSTVGGSVLWFSLYGKKYEDFFRNKGIELPYIHSCSPPCWVQ